MSIIICPGIHPPQLSQDFIKSLRLNNYFLIPTNQYPPYSPQHILEYTKQVTIDSSVLFIAFSAGVVGAIGAARMWQRRYGTVTALIALDGWGVPLQADFPIHRLSHDYFTHWSSALLGMAQDSFYAEPSVSHLDLWRSPAQTRGWWVKSNGSNETCLAAEFINRLLARYQN